MKLLSILKWSIFLLLLTVLSLGGGVMWLWQNSDQLVERTIQQRFRQVAPDLLLEIGRTQLISPSVAVLQNVQIRDRESERPLAHCSVVTVQLDETELVERQRVVVKSVEASGLDVVLTRQEDGRWNWQRYQFQADSESLIAPPAVLLSDIRALVSLEHGNGIPPARLFLTGNQFQALPTSRLSYEFQGAVILPEAGALQLTGDWDGVRRTWKLGGRLRDVQAGRKLLDLAVAANPRIDSHLRHMDTLVASALPSIRAESELEFAAMLGTSRLAPRFAGILDIDFRIAGDPEGSIPEFLLKVDVREGQLSSSVVPDKLTGIAATIFRDNQNVIVRVTEARDADARISGEFRMETRPDAPAPEARLHVEGFFIDDRLRPLLTEDLLRFFEHFKPIGRVSADVALHRTPDGRWVPDGLTAVVEEGSGEFHKFQYPVHRVSGTIRQRPFRTHAGTAEDVWLDVDLVGFAGDRPATARGVIQNPGPDAEMRFELNVSDLPIDRRFRDALEAEGQIVADALNLRGTLSAQALCHRPPGPRQPTEMKLTAVVSEAAIRFRHFPYEIDHLTGRIDYDTLTKHWDFRELNGRHGEAQLTGEGTFRGLPRPGVLDLTVTARNGVLDSDLYNALARSQQDLWSMLQPKGRVNLTAGIHWTSLPGQKAIVRLPQIEVFDAEVFPRPFPYRIKIDSALMSFDPNDPRFAGVEHCAIHELQASHGGAPITASGWAESSPDGFWQLHLNDLQVTGLHPDEDLRVALPDSWRETLGRLSHHGRISIENSQLDFRGRTTGDAEPTAAWDMRLRLKECGIMAGLNLENVSGLVMARGTWDGSRLKNSGTIQLDSLQVLGMPLTRIVGPYSIDDHELLFGSRAVFEQPDPIRVAPSEQVQAEAYGGSLLLDGLVDMRPGRGFRVFGTINNARLESYAAMHIRDQLNLKGIVNSWVYFRGEGESARGIVGRGQLQISPAALYELPLMVKLLSALGQFNPSIQNRTAFDYALLTFEIRNQAFQFNPIDLVGDSLALRGKGTVGFGGDVVLDFYSRPAKPRSPSIPLVNALLFTGATQWVGVQVRGTIDRPQTEVKSAIQLDESLRQFLSAFQPNPNGPVPGLNIPSIFSMPPAPQAFRSQ